MPNPSKEEFLAKWMAKGERAWEQRARHPKVIGRPSHREADFKAIAELVRTNAGVSGPKIVLWTQAEWIDKVGKHKGNLAPGWATIIKNLKAFFSRNMIPMHLIPAKMVQAMPREARLQHLYALAVGQAFVTALKETGHKSVSFSEIDDIHRHLCAEHLWTAKRLPEAQRREWIVAKWNKTENVPIFSRKPTAAPTPATPRKNKTR